MSGRLTGTTSTSTAHSPVRTWLRWSSHYLQVWFSSTISTFLYTLIQFNNKRTIYKWEWAWAGVWTMSWVSWLGARKKVESFGLLKIKVRFGRIRFWLVGWAAGTHGTTAGRLLKSKWSQHTWLFGWWWWLHWDRVRIAYYLILNKMMILIKKRFVYMRNARFTAPAFANRELQRRFQNVWKVLKRFGSEKFMDRSTLAELS